MVSKIRAECVNTGAGYIVTEAGCRDLWNAKILVLVTYIYDTCLDI
jgi:hypothetical protein